MIEKIEEFFKLVSGFKVLVVGETIIDEFVPVSYEGNSMKSNCPVLKYDGKPMLQEGGASAIYNHLKDFVSHVDLISNPKGSIVKTRFFDPFDNRKHVEINKFDKDNYGSIPQISETYDLVIVADFGHGYCDSLKIDQPFCVMAQTNSNNFGFNRVSKWKNHRKLMTCLDLREASLQMNKHYFTADEQMIREIYHYELNSQYLFVTTGKTGSVFTDGNEVMQQPVYKTDIVDTIGAGDTFFTFASLISSLENKAKFLFIPGLAASLSTTWLCNEYSVNKNNLLSHASKFIS
jgi:bifunctional ADP-heptose synthase (sugar kinase/adenylyltransferase)